MFSPGFFAAGMFSPGFFELEEIQEDQPARSRGGWRLHGSYTPPVPIHTDQDFIEQLDLVRASPGMPLPDIEAVVVVFPPKLRMATAQFDLLFGRSASPLF